MTNAERGQFLSVSCILFVGVVESFCRCCWSWEWSRQACAHTGLNWTEVRSDPLLNTICAEIFVWNLVSFISYLQNFCEYSMIMNGWGSKKSFVESLRPRPDGATRVFWMTNLMCYSFLPMLVLFFMNANRMCLWAKWRQYCHLPHMNSLATVFFLFLFSIQLTFIQRSSILGGSYQRYVQLTGVRLSLLFFLGNSGRNWLTIHGPYILESVVHDGFTFINTGAFPYVKYGNNWHVMG